MAAILENPKLLSAELGHDGIMELMNLLGMFSEGGRVPLSEGKDARYENYYIDPETGELKRKPKLKPKAEPHWKYDIDEEGNLVPKPKIKPQLMASGGLAKMLGE